MRERHDDAINHPTHYTSHPSGVECITIAERMSFCMGCALKYLWRADLKSDAVEDLKKARWYIDREIALREGSQSGRGRVLTSDCCGAPATVQGCTTRWYQCTRCGDPCDTRLITQEGR